MWQPCPYRFEPCRFQSNVQGKIGLTDERDFKHTGNCLILVCHFASQSFDRDQLHACKLFCSGYSTVCRFRL